MSRYFKDAATKVRVLLPCAMATERLSSLLAGRPRCVFELVPLWDTEGWIDGEVWRHCSWCQGKGAPAQVFEIGLRLSVVVHEPAA